MATDKEIEAAAKAIVACAFADDEIEPDQWTYYKPHARAALTAAEQVRAEWPTDEMVTAAELKMPSLGRLQIRSLFETMMQAAPSAGND